MSKYTNLSLHLASIDGPEWRARFSDISDILGFPLPKSAYTYAAWWANQSGAGHVQSSAWQSAGWRTGDLDLEKEEVVFYYSGGDAAPQYPDTAVGALSLGLTIEQAKAGLATRFGVNEDKIEITIRG